MAASEQFEDICPRCLEPHMVDGDTLVGSLCQTCAPLSVFHALTPTAADRELIDAKQRALDDVLRTFRG